MKSVIPCILCVALSSVSAFDMQMMSTRPRPRSVRHPISKSADPSSPSSSVTPPVSSRRTARTPSSRSSSSSSSNQPPQKSSSSEISRTSGSGPSNGGGVTSTLISRLAVYALKLRLAKQSGVKCDVTATSSDLLLKQQVGPVTVRGRDWVSQLGLTCRAIEATVQTCDLDMKSIVTRQKLILTVPARGDAMVALDGHDFASFITHPLMRAPRIAAGEEGGSGVRGSGTITFLKEGVKIDATTGSVMFYLLHHNEKYKCDLRRGPDENARAIIDVYPASEFSPADIRDVTSKMLTDTVSNFFNDMVFELDGTFLSFRDMMVTEKGKGGATVMLALDITVKKFPSPGLAF